MAEMRVGARLAAVVSGDATAVVGRTLVALIDSVPSSELTEALWDVVEREAGFDEALVALGAGGFAALPSLVVIGWHTDGVRLVLRGEVGVEVSDHDGMQIEALVGRPVRSWSEHTFDGVGSVRAWVGSTRVATPEFLGYAIDRGIAAARGIDVLAPVADGDLPPRPAAQPAPPMSTWVDPLPAAEAEAPAAPEPVADDPVADEPAPDAAVVDEPAAAEPAAAEPDPGTPAADASAAEEPADEPSPGPSVETIMESSVAAHILGDSPDALGAADEPAMEPAAPAEPEAPASPGSGAFDHLFGATEYRVVEDAAVRQDEDPSSHGAIDEPGAPTGPDHDGHTVSVSELRSLLAQSGDDQPSKPPIDSGPPGFAHLAIRCAQDHLNPPHASVCRVCNQSIGGYTPVRVKSIDLGVFRFTDGVRIPVRKPMLIGRSPKMNGPIAGEVPELVTVASPTQDISRTHLEVRVEGWQVMLIDRGSTNGTTVTLAGRDPQRLRPEQPFPLPIGARVDLAGEAEFVFEVGT